VKTLPEKTQTAEQTKKAYSAPTLHVYGTVEKLTLNAGPKGSLDGGGGAAAGPKTR
jgi:hypothetical protein